MRKNKPSSVEEPEAQADWLTTYSDMVTLLMTFFVLLFAISNVDAQKFALLAAGLSRDGITAEQFLEIQEKHDQMIGVGDPDPDDIQYPGVDDENQKAADELGQLHTLIFNYINENDLEGTWTVNYDGDQLLLTITNDIWFESGSAEISETMRQNAEVLASLLRDTQNDEDPFDIIVVGHTDNVPIDTFQYPSNWYLSVARAVSFLEVLLEESGLSSTYVSARGCGEEVPLDTNDTPEGRQRNRRVEVLISQPKKQT